MPETHGALVRLPVGEATDLAAAALLAAGATEAVAALVAEHAVDAELAGHPSHGLRQIPLYCAGAGKPGNDLTAAPSVVASTSTLTTIDARQGLGHPALALAVDFATADAATHGIAAAAVIRCGHAGRAGAWAERGAQRGCMTIIALGGTTPPFAMTALPGAVPAVHTNPLAIAAPASGEPLLLDMATSIVAAGKVPVALARGTALPEGSIATREGQRSGDPADLARGGALLPVGGHKGFGLSAMIEALSVGLIGADADGLEPHEGALVICLATGAFRAQEQVVSSLDALRRRLRESSRGDAAVLAPGDPEARSRADAGDIVTTDSSVVDALVALARRHVPREEARQ